MGFDAGDSNLYRYVNNAPTNFRDPSGLAQVGLGPMLLPPKGAGDPFTFALNYDVDKKFLGGSATLHSGFKVSGELIRVGNPQNATRLVGDYNADFTLTAAVEKTRPVFFGKVIFEAGVKVEGHASGDLDLTIGATNGIRVKYMTGNARLNLQAAAGIKFQPANGQPAAGFALTVDGQLTLNKFDFSGLEVVFNPKAQGQKVILQKAPLFSFGKVTGSLNARVVRTIGKQSQSSTSNYTPIDEQTTTTTSKFSPVE